MADDERRPEIVPEATAKRRLLIYTVLRLTSLVALAAGILIVSDGVDIIGVLLIAIGAASLFVRPSLLARTLGRHW